MKNIKIYFIIILGIFVNAPYSYSQKYFEVAKKEYLYGDLQKSIELLTASIKHNEEIAKSYMYRGAAKAFLKMYSDALVDLNLSKKIDPNNPKMYFYFGKFYLLKGNYDSALKYFNIAISKDPKDAVSYDGRATVKGLLNNFNGAIQDDNIAISLDSSNQIYYTNRGFAKFQLRQYEASIKDFDISLKLEANHKAYANRGYAFYKLGLQLKAIDDYTNALSIMPDDFEIFYRRGLSYVEIGKIKEACADLNKSKELGYKPAEKELLKIRCN